MVTISHSLGSLSLNKFRYYTLGMRGYHLAIPLALWLIGPLWLLAGTALLIATLYRLDRGV